MTYPALTNEQREALEAFAEKHGAKNWRGDLGLCWAAASYPRDALHPHALQQVRNRYGGTWLHEVYAWGWTPVLPVWTPLTYVEGAPEKTPGAEAHWSAPFDPPAIGDRVRTRINGLGLATVTGYFVEGGYLGLITKLDAPPEWYVKQNGGNVPGHSFGAEIALPEPAC